MFPGDQVGFPEDVASVKGLYVFLVGWVKAIRQAGFACLSGLRVPMGDSEAFLGVVVVTLDDAFEGIIGDDKPLGGETSEDDGFYPPRFQAYEFLVGLCPLGLRELSVGGDVDYFVSLFQ